MTKELNIIPVGNKVIEKYLTACFYELSEDNDEFILKSRGNNVKRCVDVASVLLREYLDVETPLPTYQDVMDCLEKEDIEKAKSLMKKLMACEIRIGSEEFNDRYVSVMDITIRGKRKNESKSI